MQQFYFYLGPSQGHYLCRYTLQASFRHCTSCHIMSHYSFIACLFDVCVRDLLRPLERLRTPGVRLPG